VRHQRGEESSNRTVGEGEVHHRREEERSSNHTIGKGEVCRWIQEVSLNRVAWCNYMRTCSPNPTTVGQSRMKLVMVREPNYLRIRRQDKGLVNYIEPAHNERKYWMDHIYRQGRTSGVHPFSWGMDTSLSYGSAAVDSNMIYEQGDRKIWGHADQERCVVSPNFESFGFGRQTTEENRRNAQLRINIDYIMIHMVKV
jgi:hypothetical protein